MIKPIVSFLLLLSAVFGATAQAIIDRGHMDYVKANLESPMYARAYKALISEADALLAVSPLSVMMKEKLAWRRQSLLHESGALFPPESRHRRRSAICEPRRNNKPRD